MNLFALGREILPIFDGFPYVDGAPEWTESISKLHALFEKLNETLTAKGYGRLPQSDEVNRVKFLPHKNVQTINFIDS